jgi:Mn-dependent DtxR family transcriptional regulator
MDLEAKILEVLDGETLKAGEIAEKLNVDKKEIDKAMKKLKKEEKITSPKRCFWTKA